MKPLLLFVLQTYCKAEPYGMPHGLSARLQARSIQAIGAGKHVLTKAASLRRNLIT